MEHEDADLLNDDEMYDVCVECGYSDKAYDACAWESACVNCGLVGEFERWEELAVYRKAPTYHKHNYFVNSILSKAMEDGFKVSRHEMFEMERLYKVCVKRFYETQSIHKRKYMLSSTFTFVKICEKMGKDVSMYTKLPQKQTLRSLEKDWKVLNVF